MNRLTKTLFPLLLLSMSLACATSKQPSAKAVATLEGRSGANATGVVSFLEWPDGTVSIDVSLTNVPPGVHGFHIHETGDCSATDASSAGGHFSPHSMKHGGPHDAQKHAGDLGNVTADRSGRVRADLKSQVLTVHSGVNSVQGKAVVLHADPDDLQSQPSGAAGSRIACGVINLVPNP